MPFTIKGKKYCVSQCVKRKFWTLQSIIYEIFVILSIIILGTLVVGTLGLIIQAIGVQITGHLPFYILNPFELMLKSIGIVVFLGLILFAIGSALTIIWKFIKLIYKTTSGTIKTFTGIPSSGYKDCRIFEECTD